MHSMRALLANDLLLPPETRDAIGKDDATACGDLVVLGVSACEASELLDQPGLCCDAADALE